MTQPPPGWPNGEPPDPQRGGWQPPPAPGGPGGWPQQPPTPGAWQAPQFAPQQPAAPGGWPQQPDPGQYGWPAHQPGSPQPQGSWESLGGPVYPPQPRPRGRGKLIASAAVVVALAAGGVTTYIAMSDSNSNGASSPRDAVQSIVTDLNKSDLIGVLDDLAPGERRALANPALEEIKQLKRLKVLLPNADPNNVSGVKFHVQGLTFADKTVPINDRVQVVQLTGGTLDVSSDAAKIPFTREFLDAAFPHGLPTGGNQTQHIDIAQVMRDSNNNQPIRIATQKVGGNWYPSIFYTIADSAAGKEVPTAADSIPAAGGTSPQDAVTKMVNALLQSDYTGAIKLLSPDEFAVMHDYGGLLLQGAGGGTPSGSTLKDLQVKTAQVSGGVTRVTLSSVTVVTGADETTVKVDGSCVDVTAKGQQKRMCASDFVTQIVSFLEGFGVSAHVTPAQQQSLEDLLTGFTKVGVDTTQSDGKWYLNPARSVFDVTSSVLSGLQDNDLLELFRFFASLGN
ncbi:MAG: hypothetical protein QOD31_84 [Pseudonocardiales bacterium]|nr:hypothetical protein [Pseudonocardiales bacterium]